MLENRVDYCCYWLGLAMLGAVPALINTNLRHQALAHTLTVVTSKAVIFSADTEKGDIALSLYITFICLILIHSSAISEVRPDLTSLEPQLYCADTTDMAGAVSLAEVLPAQSEEEDILAERKASYQDILLYIYTSGTTGMPKAATVRHSRYRNPVSTLSTNTNIHSVVQVPDAGARHEGAARPRPAGCPLLRPAHVPRGRGGDRAGRRHVPGPHHGLQEEVLSHEVLARLPPARGHGEQPRVGGGAHVQTAMCRRPSTSGRSAATFSPPPSRRGSAATACGWCSVTGCGGRCGRASRPGSACRGSASTTAPRRATAAWPTSLRRSE